MCDTEHMFQCSDSTQDTEITALARSIQTEGVLDSTLDKIMNGLVSGMLSGVEVGYGEWEITALVSGKRMNEGLVEWWEG